MIDSYRNLIGGEMAPGANSYDVENPATLTPVGRAPLSSPADVDLAVIAALKASTAWGADLEARGAVMARMADRIEANAAELGHLLTLEHGRPLANAIGEFMGAARMLRHFAAWRPEEEIFKDGEFQRASAVRAPLGVVGLIIPWNVPIGVLHMKLAPALAAGNTVVIKPAPTTPLATLRYLELIADIVPAGVINSVTGFADVGAALVAHPGISKISLTGSVATGRHVMRGAAETLKRLTLELGGNDAAILLDDIDPDKVAANVFRSSFGNSGQICVAIKRLYVHERHFDAVVDRLKALADAAIVGNGLDECVQMGPLQNRLQYDVVQDLIADSRANGATVHGGDGHPDLPGHFIRPTIVTGLARDARLVREEQFGPVLPVLPFSDECAVIAEANAVDVGLGGSVWSADPARAAALVTKLDAGNLFANHHGFPPDPQIPFGGVKASGFGYELGPWGFDDFSNRKILSEVK
ncbi:MAG: aldehyde dehydrogenase family protein [Sphingomonadales bacterium]|nr:aldehyde dehydrogenase family protein [Sphingomonadaceae bacterium]MBS3932535.1 aldehyde dehydrogenase family protein [Sphingomonadales bacterium]